ncbi:MAG: helix-turn-helix domain-containing protein [Streptosporangiaceae bacterium]
MSPGLSTVVERRRLRADLRRARQDAGLTQDQVAAEMDWSLSKIIRIETGSVSISTNDLRALLRLYGISNSVRVQELVDLAKTARQSSWWSRYRGSVPPVFFQYLEYEAAASVIRHYESYLVPGLLQTRDYGETVIAEYKGNFTSKTIQTRLEIRMTRQDLLAQAKPPRLYFVLDEAVIRHVMGDERVRDEQIQKLIDMARKPAVTIEVVPFSAGLHRGLGENFTMLEFRDTADDDVLYFESARDALFSHGDTNEVILYREVFEELRGMSLGPKRSLAFLAKVQDEIIG